MPAATSYTPDDRALRTKADDEFKARIEMINRNAKYYRGEHDKHLKVQDGVDDNVILNLCGQAVDRSISFAIQDFPSFSLDSDDNQSDIEKELRTILDQGGDAAVLLKDMMLNGAVAGQCFVRIVQPMNDNDMVRIVPMNGERVIKFWDASDVDTVLWYEVRWNEGKMERRQDIVAIYPMVIEGEGDKQTKKRGSDTPLRWDFIEFKKTANQWEQGATYVWAYPLAPIIDVKHMPCANNAYGVDEFGPAPLNDKVNKIASDINKILRYNSSPKTIGTGFEASAVQQTGIDEFWTVPNENAKIFNLEMSTGALQPAMEFLKELKDNFFDQMRVRMESTGESKRTATEIRLDYSDMLNKTATLWAQYGKLIVGILRRLLMLRGMPYDGEISLDWQDPLPMDEQQNFALTKGMLDLGLISKKSAAKRMGIDYDTEVKLMEDEVKADSDRVLSIGDMMTGKQPQATMMPVMVG